MMIIILFYALLIGSLDIRFSIAVKRKALTFKQNVTTVSVSIGINRYYDDFNNLMQELVVKKKQNDVASKEDNKQGDVTAKQDNPTTKQDDVTSKHSDTTRQDVATSKQDDATTRQDDVTSQRDDATAKQDDTPKDKEVTINKAAGNLATQPAEQDEPLADKQTLKQDNSEEPTSQQEPLAEEVAGDIPRQDINTTSQQKDKTPEVVISVSEGTADSERKTSSSVATPPIMSPQSITSQESSVTFEERAL